jgi:hypothetical protein
LSDQRVDQVESSFERPLPVRLKRRQKKRRSLRRPAIVCSTNRNHFRNLERRVMLGFEDDMDRRDFDVLRHSSITTVGIQEAMIIVAM